MLLLILKQWQKVSLGFLIRQIMPSQATTCDFNIATPPPKKTKKCRSPEFNPDFFQNNLSVLKIGKKKPKRIVNENHEKPTTFFPQQIENFVNKT